VRRHRSADITYIRLRRGFLYLAAILDWYSRHVPSSRALIEPGRGVLRMGAGGGPGEKAGPVTEVFDLKELPLHQGMDGFTHEGTQAVPKCPLCQHPQAYFEMVPDNF